MACPRLGAELDGKVALVTGASKGIGFAIANAYAEAGAKMMLRSRKQDQLAPWKGDRWRDGHLRRLRPPAEFGTGFGSRPSHFLVPTAALS